MLMGSFTPSFLLRTQPPTAAAAPHLRMETEYNAEITERVDGGKVVNWMEVEVCH